MPRTAHHTCTVPERASLLPLRRAYLNDTRRAYRELTVPEATVHLTLVTLRLALTGEPTQHVELLARILKGGKSDLGAAWMRAVAARLGMTDCGVPLCQGIVWSIRGTLTNKEAF